MKPVTPPLSDPSDTVSYYRAVGNVMGAARTADNGISLRQYFTVLSWWVVLVGASVTGVGVWFFGGYGGMGWAVAAAWALACVFFTGLLWGFVALCGLVADHIGNSWEPPEDPSVLP